MVVAYWFTKAFISLADKLIDYEADDMAISLHTSTMDPTTNQHTWDFFNDLTNQLTTANGYTAEDGAGAGFSLVTPTRNQSSNVVFYDSANPQWTATGAGFTARFNVVSDVTPGAAASDPLLWYQDFESDQTASGGGTFTITVDAGGHANVTVTDDT